MAADVELTDESQEIVVEVLEGPEAQAYAIIAAQRAAEALESKNAAKQSEILAAQSQALSAGSAEEAAASEAGAKGSETLATQSAAAAAEDRAAVEQLTAVATDAAGVATAKSEIAQAQADLILGRGLYLPEDNLSIAYNPDGTVNTVSNGVITKKITYSNGVAISVATI